MIGAARVQFDLWDKEDGYYLNGTYYGDKNLLAIGAASQIQDGHTASTIDFLLEKKVLNGGAIESEYSNWPRRLHRRARACTVWRASSSRKRP